MPDAAATTVVPAATPAAVASQPAETTPAPNGIEAETASTPAAPATAPTADVKRAVTFAEIKAKRLPTPAPSVEDAKAARTAMAAPAAPPTTTVEPAKPATTTVEVDVPAGELKALTKLLTENREIKAQLKASEAATADAALMANYRKLKGEGKHLEAAKLIDFDLDAGVTQQLAQPATTDAAVDPKLTDIEKKELAELKADKAARDATVNAETRKRGEGIVVEYVKKEVAKYPYLAKNPEWIVDAINDAAAAHDALVKDGKAPQTDDERDDLVKAALADAEASHAKRAKLYAAVETIVPAVKNDSSSSNGNGGHSSRPVTITGLNEGGLTKVATKEKSKVTWHELRTRRRSQHTNT